VGGQATEIVFAKGTELGERRGVRLEPVDQTVEVLQDGYVVTLPHDLHSKYKQSH
jgi:hypothetical protein